MNDITERLGEIIGNSRIQNPDNTFDENSKARNACYSWQITLRPPASDDDGGAIRVRRALKCLLRSYGLTCTHVVKLGGEAAGVTP